MNKLFITDFDGVICDSVWECLLVTYNAYHGLHRPGFQRILDLNAIDPAQQQRFRALRPYLKGAEDFVPILIAIERQIPINNQADFNRLRESCQAQLPEFQQAFYAERDFLQRNEHALWVRLNPLFEGMKEALQQRTSFDTVYILTTKRQEDVLAIFAYQEIPFPADHIFYMKASGKSKKLLELLQAYNADFSASAYVEDQVDFVVASRQQGIGSYLVEWGYVSEEQKALAHEQHVPIITLADFRQLLQGYR